jgi:hypothetical protein
MSSSEDRPQDFVFVTNVRSIGDKTSLTLGPGHELRRALPHEV